MKLKLIVIRSADIHRLKEIYSLFGLRFDYHRHGTGPYHYSAVDDDVTMEIYPLAKGQEVPDQHLRLGFTVNHFDEVMDVLEASGIRMLSQPTQTAFGYMATIADPDGRKIELYRRQTS